MEKQSFLKSQTHISVALSYHKIKAEFLLVTENADPRVTRDTGSLNAF